MNTVTVIQTRHFSAHHALLRSAENYLEAAKNEERFCSDGHFVSLVMSALAVESLCNTAGEAAVSDWKDFDMTSPGVKVRVICEHLGIPYDKAREPFSSLLWLMKFRNTIAHARPQPLCEKTSIQEGKFDGLLAMGEPQSKLEALITIEAAERAVGAVNQFQEMLFDRLSDDVKFLVGVDFSESSVVGGSDR